MDLTRDEKMLIMLYSPGTRMGLCGVLKEMTLPSDARELQKCVKVIRHLAVVLVAQHAHAGVDVACLALSKTARPHNFLDFLRCCVCQRIDIRILCVEILHHNIDPRIGALCGQADTDEQLPRLVIVKRTVGVRIFLFQTFNSNT